MLALIDAEYTRHPFYGSRKIRVYLPRRPQMHVLHRAQTITDGRVVRARQSAAPFYAVAVYLILEFARPQSTLPGLEPLHLPRLVGLVIVFFLFATRQRFRFSDLQTKWFIAWLVFMVPHIPLATNNYWAFHTARAMLISFVAYLGIITFVDSRQRYRKLIDIWLGIHVYLAVMGLLNKGRGIGGFIGDENDFCLVLNMVLPIAFFTAMAETRRLRKIVYFGLTFLFIATIMATLSRGGFVGLCAVGAYCWLRSPNKMVSLVCVGLLMVFMFYARSDEYWKEVQSIQDEGPNKGTGGARLHLWGVAWDMFLDHPIWGVGQGNFPWRIGEYEVGEGYGGRSHAGRVVHSLYFTLFSELGLIGVVIFLAMLFLTWKDIWRTSALFRHEKGLALYGSRGLEGSLVGYLASGAFISVLYYPCFWVLMGFAVALKHAVKE